MKRTLLVLLSASVFSGYALAAPEGYFVGGFGEINITDRDKDDRARFDFIDDGKGLGLELGYFYGPRWGGRIEWSNLEFDSIGNDVSGDRYGIDALYRLTEGGSAYAIMGLKHLEAGKGHSALNLGLGAHGMMNAHLSAFAEATVYGGIDKSFTDVGAKLGLRYHFAGAQTADEYQPVKEVVEQKVSEEPVAPPKDLDKDGVTEDQDLCPDSDPKFAVDQNGCVVLESVPVTMKLNVLFANNSAEVDVSYRDEIARVAAFMRKHPQGRVEIAGHTSDRGNADYNMTLSEARAKAVADILTDEFGIDKDRVSAKGYGETRLLDDSGTDTAALVNRRIEAVFTATEQRKKRR